MPIVKKAPGLMTREIKLEEPVNQLLEDYARFIESNAGSCRQQRPEKTAMARSGLPQMARRAPLCTSPAMVKTIKRTRGRA